MTDRKYLMYMIVVLCVQLGFFGWQLYMWIEKKQRMEIVRLQCAQTKPCISPNQLGLVIRYLENIINLFNKLV